MSFLRCIVVPECATVIALGQSAPTSKPSDPSSQPEALVRNFYQQVVARHPTGIPMGADMKIFAPYLSMSLLRRIDLANACARDWIRQDKRRMLMNNQIPEKAPFGWAESGLFSGADERTEPNAFVIERVQSDKDGSFRVVVRLSLEEPPPEVWEVAAVLVWENGHLVVNDVIYLKDRKDQSDVDYRLSESLSRGCDGPHWVGGGDQQSGQKPQQK